MSDGIVLVGLPGSGKTTVGRAVAERLGRQFIDIDWEIRRIGDSPAFEVLARDGEPRLREIERVAVSTAVKSRGAVIATGGGTVVDPLNRWLLMEHGVRVRLDAPIDQLAERLLADTSTPRPLLTGDLQGGLRRSWETRRDMYAAVDAWVDASGDTELVALSVIAAVEGASRSADWRLLYDREYARHHPVGPPNGRLVMGAGITAEALVAALDPMFGGASPVFVADARAIVASPVLELALTSYRSYALEGGESNKTFAQLESVLTWLSEIGAERSDPLIVVGGGVLGDLGGLAAALHGRGMPLVQVPTTWLAQADSALGGKVAVDLPTAKNAVGAVWPAWLIVADARLPESLPIDRRRDGMTECLKSGLIGDPQLWRLVEERGVAALNGHDPAAAYALTERSARLKLDIVDRDPYENGERRQLNLGHTLGHALEIESGYSLAHGEAVALGLRAVAAIAADRGAEPTLRERIDDVLSALGFPLRRAFDPVAVARALSSDKKRERGMIRWILPMDVGRVEEVSDVADDELATALATIAA